VENCLKTSRAHAALEAAGYHKPTLKLRKAGRCKLKFPGVGPSNFREDWQPLWANQTRNKCLHHIVTKRFARQVTAFS